MPDLDLIKSLECDYFSKLFFPPKKKQFKYFKNRLPLGRKKNGDIWYADLSEAIRMIALGMTRSGKTFLLRSLADRLKQTGSNIFFPSDVKDEMKSSKYPVQDKFRGFLLEHEEPQSMNTLAFRPTFFRDVDKDLPKDNHWLSFNPSKITKRDFLTLFNATQLSQIQQTALHMIYDEVQEKIKGGASFSPETFLEVIDEMESLKASQKTTMKQKFYPLQKSSFYMPEHDIDIIEAFRRGHSVTINMNMFDSYAEGSYGFPFVMFSILLREIINARKKKILKNNVWVIIDEAARFVPADKKICSSLDVQASADQDTAHGVNYFLATQNMSQVPNSILNQCRYVFLPSSITTSILKDCLIQVGLFRNFQTAAPQAAKIKREFNKFEWLVIDRREMKKEIIKPLAPLSFHTETQN